MKYIKINENGIHIVFGITDRNQIKLLHFSKADFCEEDICKFGPECKAEDLARRDQLIDEAFQLVQVNLAGYDRPYEKTWKQTYLHCAGIFIDICRHG